MNLDQLLRRRPPNRANVDRAKQFMQQEIDEYEAAAVDMMVTCAIALDRSGDPELELPPPDPLSDELVIRGTLLSLEMYKLKREGALTTPQSVDDYRISAVSWLREALERFGQS